MMADLAAGSSQAGDRYLRWNYSLALSSAIALSIAGQLTSATLVLPFLYLALGAPVFFVGLVLPLRMAAQLSSELLIAPFLKQSRRAKLSIFGPMILAAATLATVALISDGAPRTVVVAVFLTAAVILGLCRGIKNVGYAQLIGAVVPSEKRGWFSFSQTMISCTVAILVAGLTRDLLAADTTLHRHVVVLWMGIAAMVAGGVTIIGLRLIAEEGERDTESLQPPGHADSPDHAFGIGDHQDRDRINVLRGLQRRHLWLELTEGLRTGIGYPWFRRYMLTRILFLSVALAMPFYTIHAASYHTHTPHGLSILVIAASAGIAVSAPLWAKLATKSNKLVIILGTFIAASSAAFALVLDFTGLVTQIWLYGIVVFLLAVGSSGAGSCANLYLIGMTSGKERPGLVAISDVLGGIFAITGSAILGYVAHMNDPTVPLIVLLVLNLIAGFLAMTLIEVVAGKKDQRKRAT